MDNDVKITDEDSLHDFLIYYDFDNQYETLVRKLENKRIVIYGAGLLFRVINKYYNLDKLNIIAVSDARYMHLENEESFLGYTVCSPAKIKDLKPDCVLVATKKYVDVIENLVSSQLGIEKIDIRPLVEVPFSVLVKEIWS